MAIGVAKMHSCVEVWYTSEKTGTYCSELEGLQKPSAASRFSPDRKLVNHARKIHCPRWRASTGKPETILKHGSALFETLSSVPMEKWVAARDADQFLPRLGDGHRKKIADIEIHPKTGGSCDLHVQSHGEWPAYGKLRYCPRPSLWETRTGARLG